MTGMDATLAVMSGRESEASLVELASILLCVTMLASPLAGQTAEDPYRWLEDVEGEEALAWVAAHNEQTLAALQAYPAFDAIYSKNLEVYSSDQLLSAPGIQGEYVYEHYQDEQHERGLWRRTLLQSYVSGDPAWETLLDLDSLAISEGVPWVYRGADCLDLTHCMVRLSRGGRDAAETREFDSNRRAFVENGFRIPEARTFEDWKDANTLYLATNFGEGTTTDFGWPRFVKEWKRGTSLDEAEVLFEADTTDMMALPIVERFAGRSYLLVEHVVSLYERNLLALENGQFVRLDVPGDARIRPMRDQLVILLNSDWIIGETTYAQGTLLGIGYDDFLGGSREFEVIFEPGERAHVFSFWTMENFILVNILHNAQSELYRYRREDGRWTAERVAAPDYTSMYLEAWDRSSDRFFFTFEGFLTPPTLCLARSDGTVVRIRQQHSFFGVKSFIAEQYEATSRDGTKIPYFIVHHRDMQRNGHNPTLLYGYGGNRTPMLPTYDPVVGTAWLERGGVYVLANIRGGGEFGPRWHQAALRENRQRAFDDFIAVAEDLVARGITAPEHLGIMGHSNGGLLVGAVFTQRPDLFGAVACLNPVLDLLQVDQLVDAGAEFGNPNDPDDWAYMKKYSPYHNVSGTETYPKVLFVTSRADDRCSPGHARKMAAKMEDMGHAVYFYEPEEGGHVWATTAQQEAFRQALIYSYLLSQLK